MVCLLDLADEDVTWKSTLPLHWDVRCVDLFGTSVGFFVSSGYFYLDGRFVNSCEGKLFFSFICDVCLPLLKVRPTLRHRYTTFSVISVSHFHLVFYSIVKPQISHLSRILRLILFSLSLLPFFFFAQGIFLVVAKLKIGFGFFFSKALQSFFSLMSRQHFS